MQKYENERVKRDLFFTEQQIREELILRHGEDLQEKFFHASVAICGLGGLGSNIAIALARAGVGTLHLIDFDKVDLSNIHRQQYALWQVGMDKTQALLENLKQIAPYSNIYYDTVRITEENCRKLLEKEVIICEAFDRASQKAMLVNQVLEHFPDKYIVSGNGMAGLSSANEIQTRKITEHFYVCGDGVSDVADGLGLVSTRVMLCAAHQAHKILQIIETQCS